ncbi:MAG: DNA-3-methyladenine glycosylase [Longimicrobiales bacterium]|nr:DNA-3-methyladenine glycosylase [Longimicrobiales bacterium]
MSAARAEPPAGGAPTGLPWHGPRGPRSRFPAGWLSAGARLAARALLGARLVSTVDGVEVWGVIVETEAYLGREDPDSHAATRAGLTARNRSMFGPAGRAYVYRSYGIHWCLNVVTGRVGEGEALLVRGVEPLGGMAVAALRRGGRDPIAAGPGRVAQALGVTGALDGHDLRNPPLRLVPGWDVPGALIRVTGRVGVRKAPEWPLRFLVAGSPGVSRAPALMGDSAAFPPPLR